MGITAGMSAWQTEHAGRLLDTIAYVWTGSDDDDYGCTQAVIFERRANRVVGPPWMVIVTVWAGPYHYAFDPGAQDELDAEVARREVEGVTILTDVSPGHPANAPSGGWL